jgi:hypothetical protein
MKARLFKVENRLASVVSLPGGRTIAEAIQRADKRVQKLHHELRAGVPAAAAHLGELLDTRQADPQLALDRLYQSANELFAIAAAIGFEGLAGAAYGLCDLVDAFRESGRPNWQAVAVYVDAIRLLSLQTDGGAADAAMLKGLRKLAAHYVGRAD